MHVFCEWEIVPQVAKLLADEPAWLQPHAGKGLIDGFYSA